MDDIKISSNKSFGIVFFIVFILISLYPLLNGQEIRLWALIMLIEIKITNSAKQTLV